MGFVKISNAATYPIPYSMILELDLDYGARAEAGEKEDEDCSSLPTVGS